MDQSSIVKVFRVDWHGHKYYVQEMPGVWCISRDYAVMCDRRRLYRGRFETERQAVGWLLAYLWRELDSQTKLDI